nr:hypothetical protein [Bacteroidota bacterium]
KEYRGEGGISRAYISNGFQLSKRFAAGIQVSYLFGSIIDETGTTIIEEVPSAYRTFLYDRTRFSDISLKGGLNFTNMVRSRTFFSAGLTYELGGNINAEQMLRLERRVFANGGYQAVTLDTISINKGLINLPSSLGFGVSLYKTFKWSIASDITLQNWSTFRDFNGLNEGMTNSYKIALGGDYTPDIASIDSYFKRITYRMGINYENSPITISGVDISGEAYSNQIKDFGITFGTSLPVSRFSSLDMAFRLGRRGTLSNNLIKEDYFRVFLGVTFNDKWFQRRKFD